MISLFSSSKQRRGESLHAAEAAASRSELEKLRNFFGAGCWCLTKLFPPSSSIPRFSNSCGALNWTKYFAHVFPPAVGCLLFMLRSSSHKSTARKKWGCMCVCRLSFYQKGMELSDIV